ncbi:MAG: hypothetical protein E7037_04310 [Verrucomicrobia bacterium]|nr:hypothetical protein [Verrucomicrobiota bacterium]
MTTIGIHKILLSALGRNPLSAFPDVKTFLAHETAPLTYPAIIASAALDAADPRGNATATLSAKFTLAVNPDDHSSDTVSAMLCDLDALLASRMTAENLNAHAEELGEKEHFYLVRWDASSEPDADEKHLSFTFTYTGTVQF